MLCGGGATVRDGRDTDIVPQMVRGWEREGGREGGR